MYGASVVSAVDDDDLRCIHRLLGDEGVLNGNDIVSTYVCIVYEMCISVSMSICIETVASAMSFCNAKFAC